MNTFDDKTPCECEKVFKGAGVFRTASNPIQVGVESAEQKAKRLIVEGRTPEEVKEILAEEGISVVVSPLEEMVSEVNTPTTQPESAPFSISDVIDKITQENKR
jgi:hypothetical protein